MRKTVVAVALMAVFGCAENPCAMQVRSGAKPLKVLMIGNSFSDSVMRETPKLAASAGLALDIAQAGIGGCPLEKHWANVEKASDPAFKPYGFYYSYASEKSPKTAPVAKLGKRTNVPEVLTADAWDIVTIQQASGKSPFYETYQPYADKLIAKIRELAPQAEVVIQETWSYSPYDARLGQWKMDPTSMHAEVKAAYAKLAKKHGLRVIPVGDAAQLFRKRLPVVYDKVLTREEIAAIPHPGLVDFHGDVAGRSFWSKGVKGRQKDWDELKLRLDAPHFNPRGHYLQACVWTAALFGVDPTTLSYRPDFLSESDAKLMRACARDAIANWKE